MFLLIKQQKDNSAKTMLFLRVIQYCKQSDIAFALLVKSRHLDNLINLDKILTH